MEVLEKKFWDSVLVKLVETMISVKVWVIFALLTISTILLIKGFITATVWGSVNAGVISTVFALREGFKVAKIKEIGKEVNNKEIIDKIKNIFT